MKDVTREKKNVAKKNMSDSIQGCLMAKIDKAYLRWVSKMGDFEFNRMFERLQNVTWKDSAFENVDWYYCEEGLYAIRIDKGTNKERCVLIKAKNPTQAIGIAVMDRTPKE